MRAHTRSVRQMTLTPAQLEPEALRAALFAGWQRCETLASIDCEQAYVEEQLAELQRPPPCPDDDPDAHAVSVAFARADRSHTGTLDTAELPALLAELGLDIETMRALRAAITRL